MYSVVLMVALTGGADTPAFGGRGCRGGCAGGGCAAARTCGGGCAGVARGCHGGGRGCGGRSCGGLFSRHRGGCGGGCSGVAACCGTATYSGCGGGAVIGGGCGGGMVIGSGAVMGGCGGYAAISGSPVTVAADMPAMPTTVVAENTSATIVVSVPAESTLTFDGVATSSTATTRMFVSPALEQGKEFYYTLKADMLQGGKTVTVSKRIAVRAGEETHVTFALPVDSVASK